MKLNLARYLLMFLFLCISLTTILTPPVSAGEAEDYVVKLKKHYQKTLPITAFSLNYHFLNTQYRSHNYWDYQTPNRYLSVRMVEFDLDKKHFYDNDIVYFSGGRLYDRAQFQNDTESVFYERSATTLGKRIVRRGMNNFDRYKNFIFLNVDFLAVRPLLEETDIEGKITIHQDKNAGRTTLTHTISDDNVIDYLFSNSPLQLVSINNRSQRGKFVYSDYQTTRGITYARTVHKYYDGAKEATYVTFNEQFEVIDKVDPIKLQLPKGYGPEVPKSDGVLVSKEITTDLYLVTDSSARRNSLFKVNGDEIMVFGGSGNPTLANKMITLILKQFPNKKITSVYVTHPHGDQISGLESYVNQGAKIIADEYSIAAIKAYPRFAKAIDKFKFRAFKHEQFINGAQFFILENMHSKRQSFVHFKDSGIIFQAHFLHIPYDNTIAKVVPSYTKAFIDFVRSKQLNISRIVGNHHNNNISVDVMNKTYDANK
jgi:hypothetical protein